MKPEKGKDFVRIWKFTETLNIMLVTLKTDAQPTVKYAVFEKCQFHNH